MLNWAHFLIVFAVVLAATALLVPPVRKFAIARGVVDKPGPRRVNTRPVPRLGGVAMYGGFLVGFVFECACEMLGVWEPVLLSGSDASHLQLAGVVMGFTLIVLLGIADDFYSLRPGVKFLGQVLAACIIAGTGTLLARFHVPLSSVIISLGGWTYPITVVYLVCFVNIINLIDGLDGLAAGITGLSAITLFVLMATLDNHTAALFALMLVAMCIAFLFFNFNPASIFMGDSGSMLLGLMLGTISLLGVVRFASITMMLVPIIIALVPIIDTAGAIIRRIRGHEKISTPDKGHIHHRLLLRGYSQRKAVLLIYLWTAVLCAGALVIWEFGGFAKWVALIVLMGFSAVVVWKLGLFQPVRVRYNRTNIIYDNKTIDPEEDGAADDGTPGPTR